MACRGSCPRRQRRTPPGVGTCLRGYRRTCSRARSRRGRVGLSIPPAQEGSPTAPPPWDQLPPPAPRSHGGDPASEVCFAALGLNVSEVPGRSGPSTLRWPPLRSHSVGMFIRYFLDLPLPFEDVETRLLAAPEVWVPGLARNAEDGGEHLLVEVGFPVDDHSAAHVDGHRTGETVPVPRRGLGDRDPRTEPDPALDQRQVPAAFWRRWQGPRLRADPPALS